MWATKKYELFTWLYNYIWQRSSATKIKYSGIFYNEIFLARNIHDLRYIPEQFMQTMIPRLMTPQTGSAAAQSAHVLLEGFSWICWRISVDLVCLTVRARVCSLVSRPVRMADVRTSIHSFLSSSSEAWKLLVCARTYYIQLCFSGSYSCAIDMNQHKETQKSTV